MAKIQIYSKIDNFLNQISDEKAPFPKDLVAQLNTNAAEADKTTLWNILALILAWFASFGIGIGMIDEGSLGPFSVARLQDGLITMPILIGIFHYGFASSGLQSMIYRRFINEIYARFYPQLSNHNLDTLLIHPAPFVTSERIINVFGIKNKGSKTHEGLWFKILVLSLFLLPLVAFIHVSIIFWSNGTWFWLMRATSVLIGIMFILRGYYILALEKE